MELDLRFKTECEIDWKEIIYFRSDNVFNTVNIPKEAKRKANKYSKGIEILKREKNERI